VTDSASSPPAPDLQARVALALAPAYEVEREIGRGGMAVVYRARDTRLNRTVAVKVLPPELAYRTDIRARFLHEAQTAARLNHPNIVAIFAVDERAELVYFVMALVDGGSVGDRLKRDGAFPVAEARGILRQVADALAYAHVHGVVHRDIKPDNILIDAASGRAMVTDFGIARATQEGDTRLTATGTAVGTPAYMSPEQCSGDRAIDGRSDLYSLGAVAYAMLTGAPPFTGTSAPSVMMKHVMERPVPLRDRRPQIPDDLDRIVMRLLEKDPADRFASGAALVAALDGAPVAPPRNDPVPARPASPTPAWMPALSAPAPPPIALPFRTDRAEMVAGDLESLGHAIRARDRARPLPVRVRAFREHVARSATSALFLVAIDAATGGARAGLHGHGHFWWSIFPVLALTMSVFKRGSALWADGVRLRDVFGKSRLVAGPTDPVSAAQIAAGVTTAGLARSGTPAVPEARLPSARADPVAPSPRAHLLRQARADRRTVDDVVARLSKDDQARIPDARATAEALHERILTLAATLDQLDGQFPGDRLPALDARIAALEQAPNAPGDGDRRLGLLKKQRDTLADVERSRAALAEQCESAGLLLQNLALDMLKMRSSGLESALGGVTSVTQEARSLSREIGYALEAADELRNIGGQGA